MAGLMKTRIALIAAAAILLAPGAYAEVIDTFDTGSHAIFMSGNLATGHSVWFNHADEGIIGGARQMHARDAHSGTLGNPTALKVDADAGTIEWWGGATAPVIFVAYGSAIDAVNGGGNPVDLNLEKLLTDAIEIDVLHNVNPIGASPAAGRTAITLYTGAGPVGFVPIDVMPVGTTSILLSDFPDITAEHAADIDGIVVSAAGSGWAPQSSSAEGEGLIVGEIRFAEDLVPVTYHFTPHDVGLPEGVELVGGTIRTSGKMGEGVSFSDLDPTFELELTNGETSQILTDLDATVVMSIDEPLFNVTDEAITFVPGEGQFIRFNADEAPNGGFFWSGESPHDSGLLAVEIDAISEITTPPPTDIGNFAFRAPGDANGDGIVDASDLAIVLANWATGDSYATGDFNGDDTVDVADLSRLFDGELAPDAANASAQFAAVPEPSSWILAWFGLLSLLVCGRRRAER